MSICKPCFRLELNKIHTGWKWQNYPGPIFSYWNFSIICSFQWTLPNLYLKQWNKSSMLEIIVIEMSQKQGSRYCKGFFPTQFSV